MAERETGREPWRMDADGGGQRRLGSHSVGPRPAVSADGKWAYYSIAGGDNFKIATDAGDARPLIETAADRAALPPTLHEPLPSPDGRRAAFHYGEPSQGGERILVFEAAGPLDVRRFPTVTVPFVWAPDGHSLVYLNTRNGIENVWRQPLDGGPAVQVTHFTSERIFGLAQSSDSRRRAIVRGDDQSDVVLVTQR